DDSGFIVDYLRQTYGDRLNENSLSPIDRAAALGMRRLMEEHLYWVAGYDRWVVDDTWVVYRPILIGMCTPQEYENVPHQVWEIVREALHAHGLGRHSRAQIYELGNADTSALASYLGDKQYFMGDNPTSLDATAYAFLAHMIYAGYGSPLNRHARSFANLRNYCEWMRTKYYSI